MSISPARSDGTANSEVTAEELDEFLAVGSRVLSGIKLIAENEHGVPSDRPKAEFIRGTVWRTAYGDIAGKDQTERKLALARLAWAK